MIGQLTGSLVLLKGIPASYQRDLQEDKPPLFEALATLESCVRVLAGMVGTLKVDRARMAGAATTGHTTATAVADALVELGVPFRSAHHVSGRLVGAAEAAGVGLDQVSDEAVAAALRASDDEQARALADDEAVPELLRGAATVDGALARCDVIGGTAPVRVEAELAAHEARLGT